MPRSDAAPLPEREGPVISVKVGTLSADLDLNGDPFERNLDRYMRMGASRAQHVGDRMTAGVTLPIAAAGAAAVKLGMDLDTTFSRMVGLAGVPAGEVDQLRESVLGLAGETGRAPQELADALYEAASAGLTSAQAMDAVDIAARGAAAGMGTTGEIVGLVASATAAYGAANIDAAKATDILTATIRAGRADPNELASTLGRILPIAAQLGVGFDEVGGAVAYLSNVFGDTNRTVTAMSGVLVKLVSPSQQGRDALQEMGTSAEELQSAIDERGLMGALDLLREKGFAGNQQALRALFDDIEGYQGALALLNDESGSLVGTMGEVSGSAGALGDAFDTASETDSFKLQQALAKIQAALVDLGGAIAPFVALVATGIGTVADIFGALPDGVQTAVLAFGALLASVGPLLSIGGRIAAAWGTISKVFDAAAVGAFDLAGNLRQIATGAAALAAAGLAVKLYTDMMADARNEGEAFADSVRRSFDPNNAGYAETQDALAALRDKQRELNEAQDDSFFGRNTINKDYNEALSTAAEDMDGFGTEMEEALARADALAAEMGITREEAYRLANSEQTLATAVNDTTGEFDTQAASASALEQSIKEFADALHAQMDPLFAAQDALLANADAQQRVREAELELLKAQEELNEAVAAFGEDSPEATAASVELTRAQENLDTANRDAVRSAMDVTTATNELAARMRDGSVDIAGAREQLRIWVGQGLITEEQARQTAEKLGLVGLRASELQGKNVVIPVSANTSAFERQIADLYRASNPAIRISVGGGGGIPIGRWTGGPMLPDNDYLVGERGPELIRMTGGAAVALNAGDTRQALSGGAGTPGAAAGKVEHHRHVTVQYPPDRPSLQAISHELHLIELENP